jgi:HSP20 family protein
MILDSARFEPQQSMWQEMSRLQEEMNRVFSRANQPMASAFPLVNLWVNQESAVVTAEIPGVTSDDLDISVVGDALTIQGWRKGEQPGDGQTYHRRERGSGRFVRAIQLPFRAEPDEVTASFRKGVLNITIPRAQADRPRKVQIKNQ